MQWELQYWCPRTNSWESILGPDYGDLHTAAAAASQYSSQSGRIVRVVGSWDGMVYFQSGN